MTSMSQKQLPSPPFRLSVSTRVFHTWDITTGIWTWCGNPEPLWRGHHLPGSWEEWLAVVHPEDQEAVSEAYLWMADNQHPIRLEYRVRRADGKWISITAHAASLSPRTVLGCVVRSSAKPLWEVPAVSPPLTTSEETTLPVYDPTYERFFDLSADLLCVADLDGHFLRVNPSFVQVLGYPLDDLLREPFLRFVHPDDHVSTKEAMDRLIRGEPVIQFRNRYQTASNQCRWLEWTARAVPAERLVFAVARDVTEQVVLRQRLQHQEERECAILDNIAALVYVKDRAGRYEFVNREWERVCNWPRDLVIGRTDPELFPDEFAAQFVAADRQVLETGQLFQGEEIAPTVNGTHTYMSVKVPLREANGDIVALVGVSTDITDRLRAEEAENQFRTAQPVQQRLYPVSAPAVPGFDIAGRWRSASVLCGDYFDYIPRADGRWVLAVGDVCGHGLGPALTMVETRAVLRLALANGNSVAEAAQVVNRQINCAAGDSLFVTLFLAELDPTERTVSWVGAGHDGRLYRADGSQQKLESTGLPLGLVEPIPFDTTPMVRLAVGDVLVLFTDGLVEAMNANGQQFTTDRLWAVVREHVHRPAVEIIDRVFEAVDQHLGGYDPKDDGTMVVAKAM
jgi:PAS domain S-box-containing protein